MFVYKCKRRQSARHHEEQDEKTNLGVSEGIQQQSPVSYMAELLKLSHNVLSLFPALITFPKLTKFSHMTQKEKETPQYFLM